MNEILSGLITYGIIIMVGLAILIYILINKFPSQGWSGGRI